MKSLIEEAENLVHLNMIMKADCPIKIETPKAHNWLVNFLVEFAEKQVKNCNIHDVSNSLIAYQKWCYEHPEYDQVCQTSKVEIYMKGNL